MPKSTPFSLRYAVGLFLLSAAAPVMASQITVKTGHYINFPDAFNSQTITVSWQLFHGSTDCSSGGGPVTTVTGVNQATGLTFETGTATSFRLVADPNGDPSFARSEQNGPFVSWGVTPGDPATILTPGSGRAMCVSGFVSNTYVARLYVGIQAFDACGNQRSNFAPGETVYFRFAGGLTFNAEPLRVLAAGGTVNECTFLPEPPNYTTVHITSDPQTIAFTLPSTNAAIPPACTSSNTTAITGNWRVVTYDSPCGCNRNQLNFTVGGTAPAGCPVNCPADITVQNDAGSCGANVTFPAPTGGGSGTVACNRASGSFFPIGSTTVTCTSSGGSTCSFNVTVNDDQDPSITAPSDITTSAGASCSAAPNVGTPVAADNCGAPAVSVARSDAQPLSAPYPLGTTTITWTATDANGNSSSDVQNVTVQDTMKPVLTIPANRSVVADSSCTKTVDAGTASAVDNCGSAAVAVARSDAQPLAAPYPLGITTLTWTATDGSGNFSAGNQSVIVSAAPLTSSATVSPSWLWPPNHKLAPVTVSALTTGGCGTTTCAITDVRSNQAVFGPGQSKDPDWIIDDATHVRLRPERTGGKARVYTITVTCTDGSGQISKKELDVTVENR